MKLYKLVLRKTLRSRFFLVAILLLTLCALWSGLDTTGRLNKYKFANSDTVLLSESETDENTDVTISRVFSTHGGTYSPEKHAQLQHEYDSLYLYSAEDDRDAMLATAGEYAESVLYDRAVFSPILQRCDYYAHFYDETAQLLQQARVMQENNRALGALADPYIENETALYLSAYDQDYVLTLYNTAPLVTVAHYHLNIQSSNAYAAIVMILSLALILCGLFSSEYESNSYPMIFSSVKGREDLFCAKALVAMTAALIVALLSTGIPVLILAIQHGGLQGLSEPVQTLSSIYGDTWINLRQCPFAISNLEYILIAFGMKLLALCFLAAWMLLCSVLLKNSFLSLLSGGGGSALFFFISLHFSQAGENAVETAERARVFDTMRMVNPCSLLWTERYLSRFDVAAVGSVPIYRIFIALPVTVLVMSAILAAASVCYRRRRNV